jgi:hypothetical protein
MAALSSTLWTRLMVGMYNEWAYSVTIGADSAIYVAGATRGARSLQFWRIPKWR